MTEEKQWKIPVSAGMMVPRCPIVFKNKKQRCEGHQHIPISLNEAARIRSGKNKAITARFSCGHNTYDKIIITA